MRFLVDECMAKASALHLRMIGHDVLRSARTSGYRRMRTSLLLPRKKRTLITHDQDFGELVFRKGMNSPHGIVAFRYEPDTPDEVAKRLLVMLRSGLYRFEGFLTAVDEGKVRQRACPIRP